MLALSTEEKKQVRKWLRSAFSAASGFNGSESAEQKLFEPLNLFDEFARAHGKGQTTSELEQEIAELSFPDHPPDMPLTVGGFLGLAATFYDRLRNTNNDADIWTMLEDGGAVIQDSDKVFVKTDEGSFRAASTDTPQSYEIKTVPRLALLISYLGNEGVNGQKIYMDDLVITKGSVTRTMMRRFPYHIVQIPRLDMEIAVCGQVGETTFVKKGTIGAVFWDSLSKEQLKARDDVINVDHDNDQLWWGEIVAFLSGNSDPTAEKVNVRSWSKKPPNLDLALIKESLLAHRQATGEWLSVSKKRVDGKKTKYVLEYGPYAGQITLGTLEADLSIGRRGLSGGTTIAKLNAEISAEHGLDYVNHLEKDDLNLAEIKISLLAHRCIRNEWLSNSKKGFDGYIGSHKLEFGPYAGTKVSGLESALSKGLRGLPGGTTIAKLNAEVSREYGLDYVEKYDLDREKIKETLRAHRLATGEWLSCRKEAPNGKPGSYMLEYGPYAGLLNVGVMEAGLSQGCRGLPGGTTIANLNTEISAELGLNYVNHLDQDDLDLQSVKISLLAHRCIRNEWLTDSKKGFDGIKGSYRLEYGPCAGQIAVAALDGALSRGGRGLPGGTTIAKLNAEISAEYGLDYTNRLEQEDLRLEMIKETLLAHRQKTGGWLASTKKGTNGKEGSYVLEHGPYAGQINVGALEGNLNEGCRGLPGGMTIAKLNAEVSAEQGLDYVNRLEKGDFNLEEIKISLLAHRCIRNEWLSNSKKGFDGYKGSYKLEFGPYAGRISVGALEGNLSVGCRGLPGGMTIADLNSEISAEHGLDYVNHMQQEDLDLNLIKMSLTAHYQATGEWLSNGKKQPNGKAASYILEHGPYAGQMTVSALEHNLSNGGRGLPGGMSIAKLNRELKAELDRSKDQSGPAASV